MQTIDRYHVVGELGRGGMGVVYEVRDPQLPRRLALKLIRSIDADPEALERFKREAEALARVKHPGVVAIHNMGVVAKGPFIVTDLVEGEALDRLCERGPLDPAEAVRIVGRLAEAVGALHAQRLLHRDLKPSNVILRTDGQPVLLDFGLARDADAKSLTASGAVMGTPSFMSPEQAGGERSLLGPWTDVYGLGAVLYSLLTGAPPFDGPLVQVLHGVVLKDPPWPRSLRPEVPGDLDAIVRRAMAKQPTDRYPTAAALAGELARIARGESSEAGRAQRQQRKLYGAAAAVGVLVVAGAALTAALLPGGPAPDPTPHPDPPTTTTPDPTPDRDPAFDPEVKITPRNLERFEAWLAERYPLHGLDAQPEDALAYEDALARYLQYKLDQGPEVRAHTAGHFRLDYAPGTGFFSYCERVESEDTALRLWGDDPLSGSSRKVVGVPYHSGAMAIGPTGEVAIGHPVLTHEGTPYNLTLFGGSLGEAVARRMLGGDGRDARPTDPLDPWLVTSMTSSPRRSWLAIGFGDGALQLYRWDDVLRDEGLQDPTRQEERHPRAQICELEFSTDGAHLVTRAVGSIGGNEGYDPTLRLWRLEPQGKARPRLVRVRVVNHGKENGVGGLDAHPTRPWLAAGTNAPYALLLYDLTTGERVGEPFVGADRVGFIDEASTSELPSAHSSSLDGVAFSPDGRLLISVASEFDTALTREAEITIWSVRTRRELAHVGRRAWINLGALLRDGYLYLSAADVRPWRGRVERWDVSVPGAPR